MNLFQKLFGKRAAKRSLENPQTPLAMPWYGPPSLAGIYVSETTALTYSAFWAAVGILSVDVANLKLQPMQHNADDGGCSPAKDHWSYGLVYHTPDGLRPAIRFWASILQAALITGNGYAEIIRKPNGWEGQALRLLPADKVTPRVEFEPHYYDVQDAYGPRKIRPWNMIHIANPMSGDAIVGRSIIATARESIGLGLGADVSMAAWYGNAARPGGVYKLPPNLGEQAIKNTREYLDAMHAGPVNNGNPGLLPPGVEFSPSVLPAPDEAYLNSRVFQIQEIARWFHMPPTKLGDYSNSTYGLEQLEKSYWKSAVQPWANCVCAELHLKLFQPVEREKYFVRANYSELTVTDLAVKNAYFASGRQWGYLSVNEIRHTEGMNGIGPAGDVYLSPANMLTDKQTLAQENAPPPEPTQAPAPSATAPTSAAALDAVRGVVRSELLRGLRRELATVRRAASKPHFRAALESIYSDHQGYLVEALSPSVAALAAVSGVDIDTSALVSVWIDESRNELMDLESVTTADQRPEAIDGLSSRWERRINLTVEGLDKV